MDYFRKEGQTEIFRMEVDPAAKSDFMEMARWTKFLAIVGFVILGLLLALGVFFGLFVTTLAESYGGAYAQALNGMGPVVSVIFIIVFAIMAGVYVYPTYALLKYSVCMKRAVATDDREQFGRAVKYLKNMFKYIGILTIVVLGLYAVEIIFSVIGVLSR